MRAFYDKYISTTFGVLSSLCVLTYLLLIFFAGVNPKFLPDFFLSGNMADIDVLSSTSQVLHVLSSVFLFLFYIKYFSLRNADKFTRRLAIIFSAAALLLSVFAYNIDALFFLIALNGILIAAFTFKTCIVNFYFADGNGAKLVNILRAMMLLALISVFLLIFAAVTYYDITIAVASTALGRMLSTRKIYAIGFMCYIFCYFVQIVQFLLLRESDILMEKLYEKYDT